MTKIKILSCKCHSWEAQPGVSGLGAHTLPPTSPAPAHLQIEQQGLELASPGLDANHSEALRVGHASCLGPTGASRATEGAEGEEQLQHSAGSQPAQSPSAQFWKSARPDSNVGLGMLFHFFAPQFPHWQNGKNRKNNVYIMSVLCHFNEVILVPTPQSQRQRACTERWAGDYISHHCQAPPFQPLSYPLLI